MVSTENVPHTNLTPEQYVRVHMDLTRRLMHQLDVRDRATLHVAMAQAWATLAASQARQEVPTPETPSEAVTRAHSHADDPTAGGTETDPATEVFEVTSQKFTMGTIYADADHDLWAITTTTRGGVPLMQSLYRDGSLGDPGSFRSLEWVLETYGPLTRYEDGKITIPLESKPGNSQIHGE